MKKLWRKWFGEPCYYQDAFCILEGRIKTTKDGVKILVDTYGFKSLAVEGKYWLK